MFALMSRKIEGKCTAEKQKSNKKLDSYQSYSRLNLSKSPSCWRSNYKLRPKAWFTYSRNMPATAAGTATTVCHRQFIPYVNTLPPAACGTVKKVELCSTFPAITVPPARQKSYVNIVPAVACGIYCMQIVM